MAEVLVHGVIGGREEAIKQAMEESSEVTRVELDNGDLEAGLDKFSGSSQRPFVIVGPEAPLVKGIVDDLKDDGYVVFGASKAAAQYEASKSRAVKMARRAGIVHPETFIAEGEWMPGAARAYVEGHDYRNYVIKPDGLTGGKGVKLPESAIEAEEIVSSLINAGETIINFARRKSGPEVTALIIVGRGADDFVVLPLSQDHKRKLDGDQGPNTGGMGAYAPVPESIVNSAKYQKICEKAYDSLAGMEAEGVFYEGAALYMGLMMSEDLTGEQADDSDLIEYNVRLGDPEAQVILPLLQIAGVDVYRLFRSAAEGELEYPDVDFANIGHAALSVCLTAKGYPDPDSSKIKKGDEILGLGRAYEGVSFQLAGVTRNNGPLRTDGGRVLYVTAVGENIDAAAARAYAAIGENAVHFADMHYRKDIGWQARTQLER